MIGTTSPAQAKAPESTAAPNAGFTTATTEQIRPMAARGRRHDPHRRPVCRFRGLAAADVDGLAVELVTDAQAHG